MEKEMKKDELSEQTEKFTSKDIEEIFGGKAVTGNGEVEARTNANDQVKPIQTQLQTTASDRLQ